THLQNQGRLPNPRFPADQDDAPRHDTAAQYTVEFFDRHEQPLTHIAADLAQTLWRGSCHTGWLSILFGRFRHLDNFFNHRIELTAVRAAAKSFRRLVAAVLTNIF